MRMLENVRKIEKARKCQKCEKGMKACGNFEKRKTCERRLIENATGRTGAKIETVRKQVRKNAKHVWK